MSSDPITRDESVTNRTLPPAMDHPHYPSLRLLLLSWILIGGISYLQSHSIIYHPSRVDFTQWVSYIGCYLPWTFLTAITFRMEARFPLGPGRWLTNLPKLFLCSLGISLVSSPLMLGSFSLMLFLLRRPLWHPHSLLQWIGEIPLGELLFWVSIAAAYFLRTTYQLQRHEQRAMQLDLEKAQLETSLNQAHLEVLRSRLNPHFLFNSLQNISMLTQHDPTTASRMLTRLGDLLRAVLRRDSQAEHTVLDEVELTRKYTALEQMRFGDRLRVEFSIAADVSHALLPSFLLQPLVENAIVHGLRASRNVGIIWIDIHRIDDSLIVSVSDNGVGLPTDANQVKFGLGLGSTRQRLDRMFPLRHTFQIERSAQEITTIRIEIPFQIDDIIDDEEDEAANAIAHR